MLKKILATAGVNVFLHIPDYPDISFLIKISICSTSDMPHPHKFEHLHSHLLIKKYGKSELVPYKKMFMSLISSVI